jgi:hypothetical protein
MATARRLSVRHRDDPLTIPAFLLRKQRDAA